MIKGKQPTASSQLRGLPWDLVPVQHSTSMAEHRRREFRSIKTPAVAENLSGSALPRARLALRVHRRRKESGQQESHETVFALTSLDAYRSGPELLAGYVRGHWAVENFSHHIRGVTFAEDASTVHSGNAPRAMASLRNLENASDQSLCIPAVPDTSPLVPYPNTIGSKDLWTPGTAGV